MVFEASRAAGDVYPVNRLGLAELGEFCDGQTDEVDVGIQEVEVSRNAVG
jgi:hypothetical protein